MVKKEISNSYPNAPQWYESLCSTVEKSIHRKMVEQADFEFLSNAVFSRTHELISATTFKRFWGKIQADYAPSARTVNALAQFLGYPDFDSFCQNQNDDTPPSNPVLGEHIDVNKDIDVDDEITLYWAPDRVCHIRYTGNCEFVVTKSEKTRLQPGDTFSCNMFINGEQLYLKDLVQDGRPPVNYICGMKGGIRYELQKHS